MSWNPDNQPTINVLSYQTSFKYLFFLFSKTLSFLTLFPFPTTLFLFFLSFPVLLFFQQANFGLFFFASFFSFSILPSFFLFWFYHSFSLQLYFLFFFPLRLFLASVSFYCNLTSVSGMRVSKYLTAAPSIVAMASAAAWKKQEA